MNEGDAKNDNTPAKTPSKDTGYADASQASAGQPQNPPLNDLHGEQKRQTGQQK